MKFKPLELVTNTFAGPSAATAGGTETAPQTNDNGDFSADELAPSESQRVRFQLPSDSESDFEETDSQFFTLDKEPTRSTRTSNTQKKTAGNRKQAANKSNKASPPKRQTKSAPSTRAAAKTPSPGKSTAKTISPQGVTPEAGKNAKSNGKEPKSPSTTTPSKEACETPNNTTDKEKEPTVLKQSQKKKRLSVYEQIAEDTNAASEQWKEYTEATLRFKKQIHKEKLKEIKEKEDDLKKLQDQLTQLRKKASELEQDIQKDLEHKKVHIKLGTNLRRLAERVSKRATKDKEDSKANLKAKDALLKQARKDAKKAALEQENAKKRKVSPDSKQQGSKRSKRKAQDDESSEDEFSKHVDSDESDADDSDWEVGSKPKATQKSVGGGETSARRQTRVRASQWKCSVCTLDNSMDDDECAACGTSRPGAIPDF